eukprot:TRINITY_DN401_c6_g1_i3.p1 TRINITY_DN401_c6_g1~~TRINITY_DN401_c6_g1_i3.p1  ORF type:complete len:2382 (+),score=700.28 TRINITY_DN401_c6_g1_i3:234-7379(+)
MITLRVAVAASVMGLCVGFDAYTITAADKATILDEHNKLRAAYGACPIEWDDTLATAAAADRKLDMCTTGTPVNGENFLEHLFAFGKPITVFDIVEQWTMKSTTYDTLTTPLTTENKEVREFTQIVWKSSRRVGCAICSHTLDFGIFSYTLCRYEEVGNIDNQFAAQVGNKGDSCDKCDGVTCAAAGICTEAGVCDTVTGTCSSPIKADNTVCTNAQMETGKCVNGACVIPDPCDGVVCTPLSQCHLKGTCANGVCSNPVWTPTQTVDPGNPGTCDDGNAFTVNDKCNNGNCVGENLCATVTCNTVDTACKMHETCDHLTGMCVEGSNTADGTPCDDANAATVEDKCAAGICVGVDKCMGKACTTNNECKNAQGSCDINTGNCVFTNKPNDVPCDDGNAITSSDKCTDGTCGGVDLCASTSCVPSDECHTAHCNPQTGKCFELEKTNGGDGSAVKCITCTNVVCTDLGECKKTSVCDPSTGICTNENMPDNTPCDDGNMDTVEDTCTAGVCTGVNKCANATCVAMDDCHDVGVCDKNTGVCSNPALANGAVCDFTGMPGTCTQGVCGLDCSSYMCSAPSAQCMEAVCDMTGCKEKKVTGKACDDNNPSTINDVCDDGVCTGTDMCASVTCTASNTCHTSACNPATGKCVKTPVNSGNACDDGNRITVNDKCTTDGKCVGEELCANVTCTQMDDCHKVGVCDHLTGQCSNPTKADGAQCDDNNADTINDKCTAGTCTGESRCKNVVCKAISQCHAVGTCNETTGLCSEPTKTDGATCDDGDTRTDPDTCTNGVCTGQDRCLNVVCQGNDPCNVASCSMGTCVVTPRADGVACDNAGSMCDAGDCINKCANVSCVAPSQCHENGVCDPMTGTCSTVPKAQGTDCNDGNIATDPDTCDGAGKCTGPNICDNVVCLPAGQCYENGVCDPTRVNHENGTCTTPWKADGIPCNDNDDDTFQDVCKSGECVGVTCNIQVLWLFGTATCTFGQAAGGAGNGGYGWTPQGQIYTDSGCRGRFLVEATGEEVTCDNMSGDYQECKLKTRMPYANCLPSVPVCQTCQPKDQCYDAGVCDPATGICSNPPVMDGTTCDDGNATTTDDKCQNGVCVGIVDPPGCFKASKWWPSRECKHDPSACNWGCNVWGTMEECCRPGNGHKDGCAPEPPTPTECWRAGKWWPTRECVKDMSACKWGLGTNVWGSKDECCKAGNGFDCGCSKPIVEQECWVDSKGTPERSCLKQVIKNGQTCEEAQLFKTEQECCKGSYPFTGCAMPCKTLDVVLVVDGSGSMAGTFTNHPHGFYALISMLEDWVSDLPLTSEKAGQILPAATANGGVRVGIVQFSSKRTYYGGQTSHAIMTPRSYSKTTGGRLSGDKQQLLTDIQWHESRFIKYGTMIERGLLMAADMFESIDRPRAIVIISDGKIFDADRLSSVRRKLDQKDIVVFGVVVRKSYRHTSTDKDAEKTLMPILSKPERDHFFNLEIDDIPEKVLHGVCDPNSQWGAYIQSPKGVPSGVVSTPGVFNPVQPSATGQASIWFRDQSVAPFDDLDCDYLHSASVCDGKPACESTIYGSSITIDGGYDMNKDTLSCPDCKNVRVEWRKSTGVLVLKGAATVREYTKMLSKVQFTSTADCSDRIFTYSYGVGFSTSTALGHTYQYFAHKNIRWDDAQKRCEGKLDLGRKGYLITVSSEAESDIAKSKLGGMGWMGASDAGTEGTWRWVAGPEGCAPDAACDLGVGNWVNNGGKATGPQKNSGTKFYDQKTRKSTGYTNWASGEPNEWRKSCPGACKKAGEDFAHFLWPSGKWNDYPIDHEIDGYICEWGETPDNSCLPNHVGSRNFTCGTNPTNPPSPCNSRPSKPPSKSGCTSGWVSVESGIDRAWCNTNCMVNGKLVKDCKPGASEKCKCLPEQVKQCRCDNTNMMSGSYCADLTPLASGLHTCYTTYQEIPGKWDESDTSYQGMPPTTAGDGDDAFMCYKYDQQAKKWSDIGVGQCWDANWQYFSRFVKNDLSVAECKTLCEGKTGCHSVHWEVGTQGKGKCYLNANPVGGCGAGQRPCSTPKTKPSGCQVCGCTKFLSGANRKDAVTCAAKVMKNNGKEDIVCRPPSADGTCTSGDICSRNPLVTIQVSATLKADPAMIKKLLAQGSGMSTSSIIMSHLCPVSTCTQSCSGSTCTTQCGGGTMAQVQQSGCYTLVNGQWVVKSSRHASALADDDLVVVFDIEATDEERAQGVAKINENVEKSKQDPNLFPKDEQEVLKALKDSGAASAGMAVPVWSPNVDESGEKTPEDNGNDDKNLLWVILLAAAGGICVAGMAGFAIYNKKTKVSWSDVADKRTTEVTDASAPAGLKVYNEMPEVLEEMQPANVPAAHGSTSMIESRLSGGSLEDPNAALL